MVDPSVHRHLLNLSESDESYGGSNFRSARKNSSSSFSEGYRATSAQGKVRRSRSRTRRPSVNSGAEMNGSQKKHVPKNSQPIDEHSTEQSSSTSSSSSSRSSSGSESSSSEGESIESSPKAPSNRKSCSDTQSTSSSSVDESMPSSSKAIPKRKSNPHPYLYSGSSFTEDKTKQSPPKATFKEKSLSDSSTGTSSSEDDGKQSSTKPISKEESNSGSSSGTSGSEDEPMQLLPKPTSKGNSTPDTNTGTSSSEDNAMQAKSKGKSNSETNTGSSTSDDDSTSKGRSISDTSTGTSNSEDEAKPTSKGKLIPVPKTATSSSEDEPMQSSPKPTSKGNSTSERNTVSSAPISEDENEGVISKLSDIQIDKDGEKSLHKKNPESVEDQQRKVLGDKLTVKFKVTLPEIEAGLIGGPLQFLRVPQFIPVESGAYDAETFKDSMTPDDLKDEQARGDFLNRLKTTVRWRENEDKTKESNARIVRWSDGSETFHVGSEVFDVMHHKVIDDKNHLYVRLENCYQAQGSITDKMTLRPKLDSTFGQNHVQGLRNRAMNKPQTGVVKVLSDLIANPLTDRDRRAKEEMANLRREEREKRREIQLSMRKPRVKPMRHCTADDSDPEQAAGEQEDLESETVQSVCASSIGNTNTQGIRTNRNVAVNPGRFESSEEGGSDSDVNDIINDEALDGDDEEMSDEPRTSTSKSQKAPPSRRSSSSDSEEGPKTRIVKRKTKMIYSESGSD